MFPHRYFTASHFAPRYFAPAVAAAVVAARQPAGGRKRRRWEEDRALANARASLHRARRPRPEIDDDEADVIAVALWWLQ